MEKDFYAGIFVLVVGIFAIYMFFHTTRERFFNDKTYDSVRHITPLPVSINFWFIKILFLVGGLLCIAAGIWGISIPFL
ncbi:hypothetical protein WQ54_31450 [Bacillus sp. SA1-12]|uniref:hypothetical protein n=1 Tax=Bacillus sp. SA1-12 TaxID=1455638 RepID=UPI000626F664|nr:hypothetical protein [Bacillus sp. SA1-12]KKI88441.1 hypothetical protein WQ54_31450 [Bacillus sp. SA1-12]